MNEGHVRTRGYRVELTKTFEFDSAHYLEEHSGKCRMLHGHRYKLEVTVTGPVKSVEPGRSDSGMIIDFGVLKEYVRDAILLVCDHEFLNDAFEYTTAEVMVCTMFGWLRTELAQNEPDVTLVQLRLWETPTSYATVEEA